MRTINIDFLYTPKEYGQEVIVEVEAMPFKSVSNPDSDWEAKDFIEITEVSVYHNGDVLDIDIPRNVIYSEISAKIRDADVYCSFMEETGGL